MIYNKPLRFIMAFRMNSPSVAGNKTLAPNGMLVKCIDKQLFYDWLHIIELFNDAG